MQRILLSIFILSTFLSLQGQQKSLLWEVGIVAARVDLNGIGKTGQQTDLKSAWGIYGSRALAKTGLEVGVRIDYGQGDVGQVEGTARLERLTEFRLALGVKRNWGLFSSEKLRWFIESNMIVSRLAIREIEAPQTNYIAISNFTLGGEAYAGLKFIPVRRLSLSLCSGARMGIGTMHDLEGAAETIWGGLALAEIRAAFRF